MVIVRWWRRLTDAEQCWAWLAGWMVFGTGLMVWRWLGEWF